MITNFPHEIIINILLYLSYVDILNFLETCKTLLEIFKDKRLWIDLLKYRFNVFYYKTNMNVGAHYMFKNAVNIEPLRKQILLKHWEFKRHIPDYTCSYSVLEYISDTLDLSNYEYLLSICKNHCEPLENYFLERNDEPNNYIIKNLSIQEKILIRNDFNHYIVNCLTSNFTRWSFISNVLLKKIMYMHKLSSFFIYETIKLRKSIFMSCLFNTNQNVLQYFMNNNFFMNKIKFKKNDFKDVFPNNTNNITIEIIEYLLNYNFFNTVNITFLLLYNNIFILQTLYESGSILPSSMDQALIMRLVIKYVQDKNYESYNAVKTLLQGCMTGEINEYYNNEPKKLTLKKDYLNSIYLNIYKLHLELINTLYELLNDSDEKSVLFVNRLNLTDANIIAICIFNNGFTNCDNIVKNHANFLKPDILNLVFSNCTCLVAKSLLKIYIPQQAVINYCALNIKNIEVLQSHGYFQDINTNNIMTKNKIYYKEYLIDSKKSKILSINVINGTENVNI